MLKQIEKPQYISPVDRQPPVPRPEKWDSRERLRRYSAEGVGTFAIVFAACGSAITSQISSAQLGLVGAAFASGFMVMAMVYTLGHICGAHFNPAVTIAFALTRHFPLREIPGYLGGQLAGSLLASTILRLMFGDVIFMGVTRPLRDPWQAFMMEIVITFFLMFVIMAVATDTRAIGQSAAIAVGVIIIAAILIAGPISGASMNPARSFGPAMLSWSWQDHWVYWAGPIIGALTGGFAYQFLRGSPEHSS